MFSLSYFLLFLSLVISDFFVTIITWNLTCDRDIEVRNFCWRIICFYIFILEALLICDSVVFLFFLQYLSYQLISSLRR